MVSARDIIADAMRLLGVLQPGHEPGPELLPVAVTALNLIVAGYSTGTTEARFSTTPSRERYKIPVEGRLIAVEMELTSSISPKGVCTLAVPIPQSLAFPANSRSVGASMPSMFVEVEPGVIEFFPRLNVPGTFRVRVSDIPVIDLDSDLDGPPGAMRSLTVNLALHLSPFVRKDEPVHIAAEARSHPEVIAGIRVFPSEPPDSYLSLLIEQRKIVRAQLQKLAA